MTQDPARVAARLGGSPILLENRPYGGRLVVYCPFCGNDQGLTAWRGTRPKDISVEEVKSKYNGTETICAKCEKRYVRRKVDD